MYQITVPKDRADEAMRLASEVRSVRVCLARDGELLIYSATDDQGRAPQDAQELFDKLAADPEQEEVEAEVDEEHDTPTGRVVRKVKKLVRVPKKKK